MNEENFGDAILHHEQGIIDNLSCKKCRNDSIKQLCVLIGVPVGGIFLYTYSFFGVLFILNYHFVIAFDNISVWIGLGFFMLWYLTCKFGFSIVDDMNWSMVSNHYDNHKRQKQENV